MGVTLWVDFETRSRVDLGAKGVYNYAQDMSTEVLCMSYAFDDGPVQTWVPKHTSDGVMWLNSSPFPEAVAQHTGPIYAHNAAFERLIFWYVLQVNFKLEQFVCTATQARANCAPGSLEDVGRFASASMKKDHRGAQLIRLLSIPQADGSFREDAALLAEMIAYCEQDVRAMREISKAMRPLSADELADYHVNERINDRGVLVDVPLAKAAMRYAQAELIEIEERVAELTDGEIMSVRSPRMREWVLARVGEQAKKLMFVNGKYSIDKTVRANLLAMENPDEIPPAVAEVIQCADDLWASSVAKFSRMADLADDEDQRVRGAFVFAGGAATGRASSYGLQVHNFTRKCAKEPDEVRTAMVRGHDIVPRFGKRVTDVLRGMLRPALIPAKGKHFVVADWSAIEGRVNPWLSGSDAGEAKLDVFRRKLDPYKVNAAATYSVAYEAVTGEQRQVGKVQELACFAAETKVLTNNGVKAIVDVSIDDLLWDGQEWVTHQGVISKGLRQTTNVCGLSVTEDHLFLVKHEWLDAKTVLTSKNILTQALETGSANLPYLGARLLKPARAAFVWSRFSALVARSRIQSSYTTFSKERLRGATSALKNPQGFGARIFTSTPTPAPMTIIEGGCSTGYLLARTDATTPKIEAIRTMGAGGLLYMSLGEQTRPRFFGTFSRLMAGISRIWNLTASTSIKDMSRAIFGSSPSKRTAPINEKSKTCSDTFSNLRPVYDILNSGSRNRFTVLTDQGPLIAHNCGFAGGVGAFAAMGRAYGVHFTEAQARKTVDAWRRANPWSVPFWQSLEEAYTRAMRNKGHEFSAGRVAYLFDGLHLWYALPSGRVLCYPYARLESDGVTYAKASWKPAADATEWPRARLWKGLACENITQATANDILRHALRQLDDVVLHVHDEIVIETDQPTDLERIMSTPPAWAEGLPLAAEVQTMSRYGK